MPSKTKPAEASAPGLSEEVREWIKTALSYLGMTVYPLSLQATGEDLLTRASAATVGEAKMPDTSDDPVNLLHRVLTIAGFSSEDAEYQKLTDALAGAAQQQAEPSDKLDAPAQVGNTVFRKGVTTRLVIEAAQRNYQRIHNPTEEDKRIAAGVESITQLRKQIEQEHDAKSPFQREVEKMGKQKGARHD